MYRCLDVEVLARFKFQQRDGTDAMAWRKKDEPSYGMFQKCSLEFLIYANQTL